MFTARSTSWKGFAKGGWLRPRLQAHLLARQRQSTVAIHKEHASPRAQPWPEPTLRQQGHSQGEEASCPVPTSSPHGGRRRRRGEFLRVSPTLVLAMRLNNEGSQMSWEKWKIFQDMAASQSLRLPVLTTQMLMMQEEAHMETSLSEALSTNNWEQRVKRLEPKGITKEHIAHWVWILSGENSDTRLERFLSTDEHKPIFLLLTLLRSEEAFQQRRFFVALLKYISKFYCFSHEGRPQLPSRTLKMVTDHRHNMTPELFTILLTRLVHHASRLWPELLESISRLVSAYILTIETDKRAVASPRKRAVVSQVGYAARCQVFNAAIHLFGKTAPLNPLANTKYNWEAQKFLLSFSTGLDRQLVLTGSSYRAIRTIIVGLEKSRAEEKVAVRSKKTWPPYRQEWDGLDERRRPEDDLSRSVKAGILAREAGYPETEYDRALGALGGAILGQSPTVQTRSMKPKLWIGKLAYLNLFSTWAAQVKATRSAQEAWRIFETPPLDGLKPNFQVYAEMFEKLFSRPVPDPSTAVPGNAKELFPPYEANLTAVEKARLQPPSVTELYDRMLQSGNRPVGKCLALLIANSQTEDMATQYLHDSPFRHYASALSELTPDVASAEALEQIPLPIFNAYISLLCKLHAEQYLTAGSRSSPHPDTHIHRAIALTSTRLRPDSPEGKVYKPPWHNIIRTLAMSRTLYVSRGPANNHLETLSAVLNLFAQAKDQTGIDGVLFDQLTFSVRRTMKVIFSDKKYPHFEVHRNGLYRVSPEMQWSVDTAAAFPQYAKELLEDAHSTAVGAFKELVSLDQLEDQEDPDTAPPALPRAGYVYRYMRTLGLYGDIQEMAKVVRWIIRNGGNGRFLGSAAIAGTRDHDSMIDLLAYFRTVVEGHITNQELRWFEESIEQLADERGIPWLWPQAAESSDDISTEETVAERWSLVLQYIGTKQSATYGLGR